MTLGLIAAWAERLRVVMRAVKANTKDGIIAMFIYAAYPALSQRP
jgi:hypothetical protein